MDAIAKTKTSATDEVNWSLAKDSWRTGLCLEGSLYVEKASGQVFRCLGSRGDAASHGAALAWPMYPGCTSCYVVSWCP